MLSHDLKESVVMKSALGFVGYPDIPCIQKMCILCTAYILYTAVKSTGYSAVLNRAREKEPEKQCKADVSTHIHKMIPSSSKIIKCMV